MAETPNVCPHLHLPLQSGSDRVLRLMRRSYRQRRYLKLVERTRELLPDAALTTDIIVGFPGETDEDFQATLDVVDAGPASTRPSPSSTRRVPAPRPPSWSTSSSPRRSSRSATAGSTARPQQSLEAHQRLVGTDQELLIESPSKTDPSRWSARTRGNHLVHLPAPRGGPVSFDHLVAVPSAPLLLPAVSPAQPAASPRR
jgi:tRNA-2-methylthio-N6-dimethylallyladenosine synthase